jgi:Ca2+/Na+ antiporter
VTQNATPQLAASEPAAETSAPTADIGLIIGSVIAVIALGAIGLAVIKHRKQRTRA